MLVPECCVKSPSGHEIHAVTWSTPKIQQSGFERVQESRNFHSQALGEGVWHAACAKVPVYIQNKKWHESRYRTARLEEQMGSVWMDLKGQAGFGWKMPRLRAGGWRCLSRHSEYNSAWWEDDVFAQL